MISSFDWYAFTVLIVVCATVCIIIYMFISSNAKAKDISHTAKEEKKTMNIRPVNNGLNSIKPKSNSRIKITRRNTLKEKEINHDQLLELINSQTCIELNVNELWQDTILDKVYLTVPFVQTLSDFLEVNSTDAAEAVEVGGFLMGRFALNTTSRAYEVVLESFVPIQPESNSLFHIEFSTRSIMMDLGDAQDKYPDLIVVGWIHTHPGHGLFLSKQDLTIQEGFFSKEWQFAMEIDSLTPELDMAIFTHKLNGEINNTVKPKNWFSWRALAHNSLQ